MKMKSLVAVAISGLLSVSLAHAAPSSATDEVDATQTAQSSIENNIGASTAASDMDTTATPTVTKGGSTSPQVDASNSNDDMSADTATGDDDY